MTFSGVFLLQGVWWYGVLYFSFWTLVMLSVIFQCKVPTDVVCFFFVIKCLPIMCCYCEKSGDLCIYLYFIKSGLYPDIFCWHRFLQNGVQNLGSWGYCSQLGNLTSKYKFKGPGVWTWLWYLEPENSYFWIVLSKMI